MKILITILNSLLTLWYGFMLMYSIFNFSTLAYAAQLSVFDMLILITYLLTIIVNSFLYIADKHSKKLNYTCVILHIIAHLIIVSDDPVFASFIMSCPLLVLIINSQYKKEKT